MGHRTKIHYPFPGIAFPHAPLPCYDGGMRYALLLVFALVTLGGALYLYMAGNHEGRVPLEETEPQEQVPAPEVQAPVARIGTGAVLDLSDGGLSDVPMDIFARTELVELDLSGNRFTGALPAEVRHLKNLERLDLSHNSFTGVPAEVGQLSKLRYLDLSYNKLTGLPYELGNLKELEVLDLTGNDYAQQDLSIIKQGLPATVRILGEKQNRE